MMQLFSLNELPFGDHADAEHNPIIRNFRLFGFAEVPNVLDYQK